MKLFVAGMLALFMLSSAGSAQIIPNRYILVLADPPVSAKFASRAEMQSDQAAAYRAQIENTQAALKKELASRKITVTGSVSVLQNLIFVSAPAERVTELKSLPGVIAVRPMRRFTSTLNRATGLMNAPAAWTAVGGPINAGLGIKIGVLDSGIDQTHAAFQDATLATPAGFPICTMVAPDTGKPVACPAGAVYTSNKVIVARSYVGLLAAGSNLSNPAPDDLPDDFSPRDRNGHGTGVASAAGGELIQVPAVSEAGTAMTIQGMAPKAWLGNYKIAGSPGVQEYASDQSMIQAVEDAVADGMDVITTSWGSPAYSDAASDPVASAFEAAALTGAVVTVAAGNSNEYGYQYPAFNSINSPGNAPDVITVGGTENSHVFLPSVSVTGSGAPAGLVGVPAQPSDTFNYPSSNGSANAPLIDVTQLGDNGLACSALPAYSLDGAFALIERGTCTFADKATNALNAGAIGMIVYMADSSATIPMEGLDPNDANFQGPAVMIANAAGVALKNYVDTSKTPVMVTIDSAGTETDIGTWSTSVGIAPVVTANMLISFSSTGPTPDGLLKPDIVATAGNDGFLFPDPNDQYLVTPSGMYMATQSYDPNQLYSGGTDYSANGFWAASGTSFATPLVAGAAALVKQAHPGQTLRGTQIKSLLVNSASQSAVLTDDFGDPVDAQWIGAGLLNAGAAAGASITIEPSTVSFGFPTALPVSKTLTLTNIGTSSATLTATVNCCSVNAVTSSVSGTQVTLSKSSIVLAAGASTTVTVTLTGTIPLPSEYSGLISLTQGSTVVANIPFMFLVTDSNPYNVNVLSAGAEGAPGEDVGPMIVQVVDQYGVPVAGSPVSFSAETAGTVTLGSVTGEPACSPASSTSSVSCNTDQFGFAYAEVVLGQTPCAASNPGCVTVNFNASEITSSGEFNIQAPPAVIGVADAAAGIKQVVPGSYAAIYGAGLSNFSDVNGTVALLNTVPTSVASDPVIANGAVLPIQIDYVTVSFDVPSAGISVAGRPTYVSPGQINVQIPWELQGQSSAQMKVTLNGDLIGNVVNVPVVAVSPAFFMNSGKVADARDTSYNLISTSNPAKRGQTIFLYANGLGAVSNQPNTGDPAGSSPLSQTPLPTVMIGGQAATVSFSGLTPSLPGLYQVNVVVPSNISADVQNVTLSIGGVTSPVATLPVQ
jgi:uncharacterized protein (TIGR03437 family)